MTTRASQGFGLGPEVATGYFSHNGANEGFQGMFIGLDPGGRGVVVLTNSENGLLLAYEVVHSVAKAYHWPVLQPESKKAIRLTAAMMHDVAGTYAAKIDGENVTLDVTIGRSGGVPALSLRTSLESPESRLYAAAPLRFFTLSGGSLEFSRGTGGRASSVDMIGTKFQRVP